MDTLIAYRAGSNTFKIFINSVMLNVYFIHSISQLASHNLHLLNQAANIALNRLLRLFFTKGKVPIYYLMARNKDLTSTYYLQLNNKIDPSLILTEKRKANLNLRFLVKLLAINRLGPSF